MSAAVPRLPPSHADQLTNNRRVAETVNNILGFQHDDSRIRTAAEVAAGVTPVNYAYAPGIVDRYGTNTSEGVTDMSAAAIAACKCNQLVVFREGHTYNITNVQFVGSNI